MRERGIGIIYISHRLEEIKEIGDRVTVLRDGKYIDTLPAQTTDLDILIKLMIGRELKEKFPGRDTKIGDVALEVKNLNTDGKLKNINFKVHRGEVLGVAGLVGSGRSEVVRAVFGADKSYKEIYKDGKMITINKPIDAIRNGIALLTEERKKDGLVLKAQVRENITMVSYKDFTVGPFIRIKEQNRVSRDYIKKLNIRTPSVFTTTENLSGGNQQKTVIAKWLCAQADIFFFDEPTRGIDVGTKLEVYNLINELVENGAAVIMISSEMPEVLGMSDRIMVMANGEIVGEFPREKANQENILNLCFKQTKNREENKIG